MKIVILDGYTENPGDLSWEGFAALGELTVYDRTAAEDIVPRIGDAEIVYTNKSPITAETLAQCPNLHYIGLLATGYNVVDVAAARRRGIPVTNNPRTAQRRSGSSPSPCCLKSATTSPTTATPSTPDVGRPTRTGASGIIRSSSWRARRWASSALDALGRRRAALHALWACGCSHMTEPRRKPGARWRNTWRSTRCSQTRMSFRCTARSFRKRRVSSAQRPLPK